MYHIRGMKYLSVCSGIEAASVAWHPLGWEPVAFAEIEQFPSAVLGHRWPGVSNLGDFTQIESVDGAVDVLVGGTPCQSFSVAGRRAGMDDPRGVLAIEFLRLARRVRPRWVVWENVPGVLSSGGGRDFGAFLGMLAELGYGWAYRVLDAQFFGVPQRRRRVFVVGHLGDRRRAAAVLFERDSLSGNPPSRRQAESSVARCLKVQPGSGGRLSSDGQDTLIAGTLGGGTGNRGWCDDLDRAGAFVAGTLDTGTGVRRGAGQNPGTLLAFSSNGHNMFREGLGIVTARDARDGFHSGIIAHTLRADGFDASEDGTGRGIPLIPIDMRQASRGGTMTNNRREGSSGGAPGTGIGETGDPSPTLSYSHTPAVAYNIVGLGHQGSNHAYEADVSGYLQHKGLGVTGNEAGTLVSSRSAVRRLTPRECERLQGFPDDYTLIPVKPIRKPTDKVLAKWAAQDRLGWVNGQPWILAADGPRYKALGNSMARPVMHWLGKRVQMVDEM